MKSAARRTWSPGTEVKGKNRGNGNYSFLTTAKDVINPTDIKAIYLPSPNKRFK